MRACGPSAAFGGANGRRLCTFCYYRNPRTETELAGARWRVAGNCRGMLSRTHPDDTLFHRHWVANRHNHPARAYSIERLRFLGFLAVPTESQREAIDAILSRRAPPPLTGDPFRVEPVTPSPAVGVDASSPRGDVQKQGMGPLSKEQVDHFRTFGFVVLRNYLTPTELAALEAEHEAALDAAFPDVPHESGRQFAGMLSEATPLHATLAEDDRFAGAAAQFYGEDVFLGGVSANRYLGASDWHTVTPQHSHPQTPLPPSHTLRPRVVGCRTTRRRLASQTMRASV